MIEWNSQTDYLGLHYRIGWYRWWYWIHAFLWSISTNGISSRKRQFLEYSCFIGAYTRLRYENLEFEVSYRIDFLGEQKTKPIQNSVRTLRGLGLSPDLIVCRCKTPIEEPTKAKISTFCNVLPSQVISVHDVGSIYRVPIMLHDQKVTKYIRERERVQIYLSQKKREMKT